jgi:ATP-dependent helicase HrpB
MSETDETIWNPSTERVEIVGRLCYGAVVLDETRRAALPSAEASRMLAEAALAAGTGSPDADGSSTAVLQAKLEILRQAFPEQEIPILDDIEVSAIIVTACGGLTSMAELRLVPMEERIRGVLSPTVSALLRNDTPDHVRLPCGRHALVHYQRGQSPWIESRLQDFFGMASGPALCRGRVPLTLHLLAPNQRAVQVTSDLAGFWQKHYPGIRRELCRRYPRHAWPEDGATATPPPPRPRR